jgi:hypothetical protein
MQLPRGTFQGIKKDIGWADLLEELQGMRFTGSVSIEVDRMVVNLVFRKGKMILAEFGSDQGDMAVERMKDLGDRTIDASLSEMTDAQLSLALEFNPESRLQNSGRPIKAAMDEKEEKTGPSRAAEPMATPVKTAPEKKPELPSQPVPSNGPSEVISLVEAIESGHSRSVQVTPEPAPEPAPALERKPKPQPALDLDENENDESIARDLRALEAMDLEGMAEKIRTNCKLMVEKLNLGHLIENENHE